MADENSNQYLTQVNNSNSHTQVYEAYRNLNKSIESLNEKVENVIDRHEG